MCLLDEHPYPLAMHPEYSYQTLRRWAREGIYRGGKSENGRVKLETVQLSNGIGTSDAASLSRDDLKPPS